MREQVQAVIVAATSNGTAALQSFNEQGLSLITAGRIAVEPVAEAVREGREEEAKVMWSALSELGAITTAAVEPVVQLTKEGKLNEAKTMWSFWRTLGADIDAVGGEGRTAMHVAAEKGEVDLVRLLHELGASLEGTPSGLLQCHLSGFSTATVPSAVAAQGRVRYELTLQVVGPCPQIGWANPQFEQVNQETEEGTGDDAHSWGADGARQESLNADELAGQYNVKWSAGDVIGIAADLDARTLSFAKNGDWIEVFSECDFGDEGIFPSITMQDGICEVNLGASPFKYSGPSDDYEAVAPDVCVLERYRGARSDFKGSFKVGATHSYVLVTT